MHLLLSVFQHLGSLGDINWANLLVRTYIRLIITGKSISILYFNNMK